MMLSACDFWDCRWWAPKSVFFSISCVGRDFQYHHILNSIFDLTGILFNLPSSNMTELMNFSKEPTKCTRMKASTDLSLCPTHFFQISFSPPSSLLA